MTPDCKLRGRVYRRRISPLIWQRPTESRKLVDVGHLECAGKITSCLRRTPCMGLPAFAEREFLYLSCSITLPLAQHPKNFIRITQHYRRKPFPQRWPTRPTWPVIALSQCRHSCGGCEVGRERFGLRRNYLAQRRSRSGPRPRRATGWNRRRPLVGGGQIGRETAEFRASHR